MIIERDGHTILVKEESTGLCVEIIRNKGDVKLAEVLVESFEGKPAIRVYVGDTEEPTRSFELPIDDNSSKSILDQLPDNCLSLFALGLLPTSLREAIKNKLPETRVDGDHYLSLYTTLCKLGFTDCKTIRGDLRTAFAWRGYTMKNPATGDCADVEQGHCSGQFTVLRMTKGGLES